MELRISRVAALVVAVADVALVIFLGVGARFAQLAVTAIILALPCVWWSQALSRLPAARGAVMTSSTPAWMLIVFGWILLLLPLLIGAVAGIRALFAT